MTTSRVPRHAARALALTVTAALAAGACASAAGLLPHRDAGPVLRERLERVELPASFTVVGDTFDEAGSLPPDGQCFDSCPWASLYYSSTLPLEESRAVVERALRDAGIAVEPRTCDETCRRQVPAPRENTAHVGTAEAELWIVDGRFDGYVMFAPRDDGGSAVEIVLGSN